LEPVLEHAVGLEGTARAAYLRQVPDEDIREQARALLDDGPEFGCWAADAIANLIVSQPRLEVPSALGHYRIVRRLASGGMGEVYEAEDPRLKRKVAIKVLHAGTIWRLHDEAQALASLRHPNICRIYDVGRADDIEYFVMELLDGIALSDRLRKRALPVGEALAIARAVASALAEAHRIGIVHRDVKPGNIVLTRNGASLIDFGIADSTTADAGVPAGTPPYMAPEQARGVSDPRSDIYSVGAVLREMVGEHAPAPVRNVIESCLREDPDERWESAADLARALEWLIEPIQASAPAPWWHRWWTGYAAAGLLAAVAVVWAVLLPHNARSSVLVPLRAPHNYPIRAEGHIAVSRDGTRVAFIAPGEAGESLVWIRRLSEIEAQSLPGTEGASLVFWSPDGQSLGMVVRAGQLQTMHVASGTIRVLAQRVPGPPLRGIWTEDGHIVYSTNSVKRDGVIYRVAISGGTLEHVTELNAAEEELRQGFQVVLPGGDKFLFVAGSNLMVQTRSEPGHTYLASFRNPGARTLLLRGAFPTGAVGDRVYYVREKQLWSQRLDIAKGQWIDEARPEISDVVWAQVNSSGLITYLPAPSNQRPLWVDRHGEKLGDVPVPPGEIIAVGVSPDGTAFVTRQEEQSAGVGLWIVRGANAQRIGSGPGRYIVPAWSADGKWIYFASYDGTGLNRRLPVPGADEELLLPRGREDKVIHTTTQDGTVAFGEAIDPSSGRGFDIFRLDLRNRTRQDWSATKYDEGQPNLSPDDRWIAWVCGRAPRGGLCVSPRDDARNVAYVTSIPASEPHWSRDGRTLYFVSGGWLHSMPVSFIAGKIVPATPERLFRLCDKHRFGARYAVDSDNRFLVRDIYRPPPDPILVWRGTVQ
jgi:Tol biopolymer transport system component